MKHWSELSHNSPPSLEQVKLVLEWQHCLPPKRLSHSCCLPLGLQKLVSLLLFIAFDKSIVCKQILYYNCFVSFYAGQWMRRVDVANDDEDGCGGDNDNDEDWWKLCDLTRKRSRNKNPEKSRKNFWKIPGLKIRVNPVPKNPGIPGFGKIPSRKSRDWKSWSR